MNSRLTTSVVAVMHRMTRCPGRGEKFWWMGEKWERRAGWHVEEGGLSGEQGSGHAHGLAPRQGLVPPGVTTCGVCSQALIRPFAPEV